MSDWKKCPTHGDVDGDHQWGCPDCVAELRRENANMRSTIEAWNHAEIMTCGCKYNKVWGGTKWQHWFVPCKEHAPTRIAELEAELQQARRELAEAKRIKTNGDGNYKELAKEYCDLESKLQEAEVALRDIAKRDPESVWCYCSEVAEKALASISARGGQ